MMSFTLASMALLVALAAFSTAASRTPRSGGGYERSLGTLEVHGKATVANSVERCLKVLLG